MRRQPVHIVDYGMGNIWSVVGALTHLGASPIVSADPQEIKSAQCIVLPGVGSFRRAMFTLRSSGIEESLKHVAEQSGTKILGICLGMQLLAESSTEDGLTEGLGLVPARVERFLLSEVKERKIPHVGFNAVAKGACNQLFKGLPERADFYFVHSYRIEPNTGIPMCALCNYGNDFVAAFEDGNLFGTQFHPEKSQAHGLRLLQNFLEA
jgi:glutamine amidotransferase